MIICEGPDGGGKTTLARRLSEELKLPMHKRASDSITGPVVDLYAWTYDDIATWHSQPLSIYDRHPLTSEHIYGPTVRGQVRPGFEMTNANIAFMRRYLRKHALVIVSLPPFQEVHKNVTSEVGQMAGVVDNIDHIYDCYAGMLNLWPLDSHICRYDYTADDDDRTGYSSILAAARYHQFTWRGVKYE